eukprot:TRINITY_DN1148_c0_g1_i40.p1 TRINITY_DN1148_c0_g1~~TRINITY_DN1148_c0_g1_i40.p1  ORF type:complete len:201 (-),score=15.18 TRINITY_DN1148_c0_g1_i40:112-714(-)
MKGKLNGLKSFKEPSVGLIAPHDIVIQPGPTSVLKNKKHFFEMLGIAYKIKWNTINIMEEKKLVSKGKKITKDQYAFMEKTNILHVVYELKFTHFYDNGAVYNPSMLDIGKSRIIQRLCDCANYLTAVAVSAHYPTPLSVKYFTLSSFWNLFSFTLATDYNFERALIVKEALVKAAREKKEPIQEEEFISDLECLFAEYP